MVCWVIGRKNCHNLFVLLKWLKTKCLLYWSLLLCTADCADTNYFPYIDFLLQWESARCSKMDGQGLNGYKVVCWYRFGETSVFRLRVPLERKWVPTTHWCWWCLKVLRVTWTATLNLGISKERDTTQGLCICHQRDCSGRQDVEFGQFIIQHSHRSPWCRGIFAHQQNET